MPKASYSSGLGAGRGLLNIYKLRCLQINILYADLNPGKCRFFHSLVPMQLRRLICLVLCTALTS